MAKPRSKPRKPDKPYPGFALTAQANGQWCKKVRGKVHFFDVWASPMAALGHYNRQAADLHAGRSPRARGLTGTPTVKDLADGCLGARTEKAQRKLITPSYSNYCLKAVKAFVGFFGEDRPWNSLRPGDFASYRMYLYDRYGVCAIESAITIVRDVFKHAYDIDLIDHPVKYGGQFNKPTAKEKRQHSSKQDRSNGKRLLTPAEIRLMLDNADEQMKAVILLGINGGFVNTDCAELPIEAVDLRHSLVDHERPEPGFPI